MLEYKIYQKIPGGKNSFHSAVLTSFCFNFHHFEHQVLKTLKHKWITSINILVDQRMLDDAIGLSSGNLKKICQTYSVSGIEAIGSFHPKINFFLGDDRLLVVFGSGNITPGGHGKNHEMFSGFYADKDEQKQLPLLIETWNYLLSIAAKLEGYPNERITKTLPAACTLLHNLKIDKHQFHTISEGVQVALVYNDETSICDQLYDLIQSDEVEKLTIVGPYFDKDGITLIHLRNKFPKATIEVYLQKEYGLPPNEIQDHDKIVFYDFDATPRAEKKIKCANPYDRKLHCKIFHFKTSDNEYCLIGSANPSKHALGNTEEKAINHEFGALYKSSKESFLKELGLTGKKVKIDVHKLSRLTTITGDAPAYTSKKLCKIKSADLNGSRLRLSLDKPISVGGLKLEVNNINGEGCFTYDLSNEIRADFEVILTNEQFSSVPKYCFISDKNDEAVSNKQLIDYLHRLINTNPSADNRSIRQIISSIESGQFNEFEIVDFINKLNEARETDITIINSASNQAQNNSSEEEEDVSQLTYEEAISAAKASSDPTRIINHNSSSRLWETLAHLFEVKQDSIKEELMDEEEEADSSQSRERRVEQNELPIIKFKTKNIAYDKIKSAERMANNYVKSIIKLTYKEDHELDILDYYQFLLVSYIINNIYCFTEYDLPKGITESKWQKELELKYQSLMIDILIPFSKLCFKNLSRIHDNNELRKKQESAKSKVVSSITLNLQLINRKCTEPVLLDKMRLIGMNVYHSYGFPDSNFEEYIDSISKRYQDMYFSTQQVFRLRDQLIYLSQNSTENEYIGTTKYGFCKIIERRNGKLKVNSLYGQYPVSEKQMKRILLQSN